MDPLVHKALSRLSLPDLTLIPIEELEKADPQLLRAKQNRRLLEYYFTCTPCLPLFILNHNPDVPRITYLDADLFFFSDPEPLYQEIKDCSLAIIGHRFPGHLRHLEIHGLYNVGWVSFTRSDDAFLCLERWRQQCIEWCLRRPENDRYADQRYLDEWPSLYKSLVVMRHKGANLAPWNLSNYAIRWNDGRVWVDAQPLIFYHFHGLRPIQSWFYDTELDRYGIRPSMTIMRRVYLPYIRSLKRESRIVSSGIRALSTIEDPGLSASVTSDFHSALSTDSRNPLRRTAHLFKGMLTRKYLFAAGDLIL